MIATKRTTKTKYIGHSSEYMRMIGSSAINREVFVPSKTSISLLTPTRMVAGPIASNRIMFVHRANRLDASAPMTIRRFVCDSLITLDLTLCYFGDKTLAPVLCLLRINHFHGRSAVYTQNRPTSRPTAEAGLICPLRHNTADNTGRPFLLSLLTNRHSSQTRVEPSF